MYRFSLIVLLYSIFSISACKFNDKELNLVMAEVNPSKSISAQMDRAFIDKVEELSQGKIKITLYTDGMLGDNSSVLELMTSENPTIDLARIAPNTIANLGCKKQVLLDVPYTFSNRNHFWNFAGSPIAKDILNEPYEKNIGIKGLFFGEEGFRHFFSPLNLKSIEDFSGKKIRTVNNETMTGIIMGLQGEGIIIKFSNLYSALQTGLVDIAEQPITNYLSNEFYKIAPNMILDRHQLGILEVVISSRRWDSLTDKQKKIFIEAGHYAGETCRKISKNLEDQSKMQLIAQGVTFTDVSDMQPWQKACSNIIKKISSSESVLYDQILELSK